MIEESIIVFEFEIQEEIKFGLNEYNDF